MTKKRQIPHTYVIVFVIIIIAAMFTWIVPGGAFNREVIQTASGQREVIDTDSFQYVDSQPQTWEIFSAFYQGFARSPKIIVFILILGGAFWILNESRAIDVGVYSFLKRSNRLERYRIIRFLGVNNIIITTVMLMFSFFGAIFGMSEETIAFTIIFVPLAISMGYDSIVGVSMSFIAAGVGFAGCLMNPFTLGIAQEIAGLQMFSGIEYRFVIWMVFNIVAIGYVLWYAARVKKNPRRSIVFEEDAYWREHHTKADLDLRTPAGTGAWVAYLGTLAVLLVAAVNWTSTTLTFGNQTATMPVLPVVALFFALTGYRTLKASMEMFVLNILIYTIVFLVVGVMGFAWGLMELAALFFAMALVAGIAIGKGANDLTKSFIAGARDILSAALVVGLAGGIIVILENGRIIDTILHNIANTIAGTGKITTLSLMYGFTSAINAVITSGTAKAALIMPILRDISEMVNLSKQATVTAFHIGDGFTNLITPTSGVLIGVLEVARIPFGKWFKWAWKFILLMVILGWLVLIPTVTMTLNGF
ncbi:MAG: AbgT family transporter [Bacteroidales bacterium]|nr:AbgT family transporter [Bacteroidales bacterium]MDD3665795.1 AbgT family transporter [Bacteroidales bacterium]